MGVRNDSGIGNLITGSNVKVMPDYVPIEFPKWVDGVLVLNAPEERARLEVLNEAAIAAHAAGLARAPSPAGIRMRRTRERRREGKMSIRCDISTDQIEALSNAGFIDRAIRNDPAEVAQGVCRLLDRLSRSDHDLRP